LGIGDWAQSPIPNPQSPIPNPQSPFKEIFYLKFKKRLLIIYFNIRLIYLFLKKWTIIILD
jgi:hypothetical protein